ncbi:polysaccharide biosynthesis/export protein [Stella humosa]|uniref:Polysaccharide biosynthesis/export protein n=1 Tax=Stella humosa TaxID=94 RepID=A0A3N1MHX3_9PROT|nr:polysaccharide biosynthesis/export family protein [Stella humosa]ROQ03353.1 polysaccharide biosynthesis/export protein [Stella humosa]BBK29640.1 hypothetical protein STHU_02740 [Stella humosa]
MALDFRSIALAPLLFLAACGGSLETGQSLTIVQHRPEGFASWTDEMPVYRLGVGDKMKVKFLITREMDDEVTVGPDGFVGIRVAGRVKAEGRTIPEVQDAIIAGSRQVLRPQSVVVALEDAVSWRIYVGGSVRTPNVYRMGDNRLSTLQAIIMAGGFDSEARFEEIVLIRRSPNNRPMLRTVNVREVIQTGHHESDVPLQPGDIVYVPRSHIGEVNLWVEQFINRVVPFQRTFNYTIGRTSP